MHCIMKVSEKFEGFFLGESEKIFDALDSALKTENHTEVRTALRAIITLPLPIRKKIFCNENLGTAYAEFLALTLPNA